MAGIDRLGYGITNNNAYIYTKRTCSDNSEMFVTSKLNMLYEQAISQKSTYASKRALKKMIQDNIFDELK